MKGEPDVVAFSQPESCSDRRRDHDLKLGADEALVRDDGIHHYRVGNFLRLRQWGVVQDRCIEHTFDFPCGWRDNRRAMTQSTAFSTGMGPRYPQAIPLKVRQVCGAAGTGMLSWCHGVQP